MLLNYDFDPIVVKNSQTAIFELLAANTCVCIIVRECTLHSSLCEVLSFIISEESFFILFFSVGVGN